MSLIAAIILGSALAVTSTIIGFIVGCFITRRLWMRIGYQNASLYYASKMLDDDWPLLKEHMKWKEQKDWPTYLEEA